MSFESTHWLFALWASPVLGIVAAVAYRASRAALDRFAERSLVSRVDGAPPLTVPVARAVFLMLAVALTVFALARPLWGSETDEAEKTGRDVVFLLDTSKSMLAEDLVPNRLERAKLWIGDTLGVLKGDRVSLVAFAGGSSVKCPLTHDYGFFRFALDAIDTQSVARGGTNIGDALRKVRSEVFALNDDGADEERFRDIILITDGEDHESFPVEAASQLGAEGVRIICIGLGDENSGVPIPLADGSLLRHGGEIVRTKLDPAMLREVAQSTPGGTYLNVATGTIELDDVYRRLVVAAENSAIEAQDIVRMTERFQVFLLGAVLCLAIERALSLLGRSSSREVRA